MSTITIREASDADVPVIAAFNSAMAHETEGKTLNIETVQAGARGLLAQPQYGFYLLAESKGEVVGSLMITYEWSDWRNGVFWWVQSVYVLPNWRGQGVYRALHEETLRRAVKAQACGIRLYVEQDNQNARAVYQRLGMEETPYRLYETTFELTASNS